MLEDTSTENVEEIMSNNKTLPQNASKHKRAIQPKPRLGQILIAVGGLMVLSFFAWALWPPATNAKFKAEVSGAAALKPDKEKIDLGDVQLGKTVSAAFQLTNVGDQPLHFTEAPYIQVVEGC
jgi:hypothetical protein